MSLSTVLFSSILSLSLSTLRLHSSVTHHRLPQLSSSVPRVYNTWEEAHAQVLQYSGANHKAFKHKLDAELAFMKFWQIEGGNVQQGSSSSTPLTEDSSSTGDVKYNWLKYQLDIAIEQQNHVMKIAKLNAKMLNAVASQVLPNDKLYKMPKWHI